mmetsp:Transcript_11547/g.26494  ORF Transcript_11547/g.26494 Transcript_11547/m.26494 type:complete len:134 (+) Transcript_11547:257-658(+)
MPNLSSRFRSAENGALQDCCAPPTALRDPSHQQRAGRKAKANAHIILPCATPYVNSVPSPHAHCHTQPRHARPRASVFANVDPWPHHLHSVHRNIIYTWSASMIIRNNIQGNKSHPTPTLSSGIQTHAKQRQW